MEKSAIMSRISELRVMEDMSIEMIAQNIERSRHCAEFRFCHSRSFEVAPMNDRFQAKLSIHRTENMKARNWLTALVASKPSGRHPPGFVPDHTGNVTRSPGRAAASGSPVGASTGAGSGAKMESLVNGPTPRSNPNDSPRMGRLA